MDVRPEFLAGAAEPILSKLLQGRKANVGAVASRPQEESATLSLSNGEQRAWGRKANHAHNADHYATLAEPPTLSVVEPLPAG